MITERDIVLLCEGGNTFARGKLIYSVRNVKDFRLSEKDGKRLICARVKGNNVSYFDVQMMVEESSRHLEGLSCSCMEFHAGAGFCKHLAAVALEYISRRDGRKIDYRAEYEKETNIGFAKLMEKMSVKKRMSYIQPDIMGKVVLLPVLRKNDRECLCVSYRIGITGFYAIRDLEHFSKEIDAAEKVRYGAGLEFYNTMSAYTEESRQMVRFIKACQESGDAHRTYAERRMKGYIILKKNILDAFMEMLIDRQVIYEDMDGTRRKIVVVDGMPKGLVRIEGKEGGINIQMERQLVWSGIRYAYVQAENRIHRVKLEQYERLEDFVDCNNAYFNTGIFIAEQDIPGFVRDILPDIRENYRVREKEFDESFYRKSEVKFQIYLDAPEPDKITGRVMAVYGTGEPINIFNQNISTQGRDLSEEAIAARVVASFFQRYDEEKQVLVLENDEEKFYELLTSGLAIMHRQGEVFVSGEMKKVHIRSMPSMQVGVSLIKGGLLQLDISAEDISTEEMAEILSRYDKKKKYFRLKNGDFVSIEGDHTGFLAEMGRQLHVTEEELATGKIKLPKYRALYLEENLKEWNGGEVYFDEGIRRMAEDIQSCAHMAAGVPKEMKGILRKYQIEGFQWLMTLRRYGMGGILADEMGLGKTLQVIAMLAATQREMEAPALIICPASLVYNWKAEIEKFAPRLTAVTAIGTQKERRQILEHLEKDDIVITSYDLLKRDLEIYEKLHFSCQIIDEAQYIKNHNTQSAKAVKSISSGFRAALTGTPVENRLSELWSIFDFVMPGFLYSYRAFREEIEVPVVMHEEGEKLAFLQKMVSPFILRRVKKDVLAFLPDKIEKNTYTTMEGEQRELYLAHVKRMRMMLEQQSDKEFRESKIQVLAELMRLRQICCSPQLVYEGYQGGSAKLMLCMDLIRNAVEGEHKLLLFSQFTGVLKLIQEMLEKEGISYLVLTGATSKEKRAEMVREFNQSDVSVFCISLKAGGTGLNLTSADIVIHYDPWWNVAAQNQATDRAHRIGQDKVVTVYKLIVKGSIEEKIVELQEKKSKLADEILGCDSVSAGEFTREELLELLRG